MLESATSVNTFTKRMTLCFHIVSHQSPADSRGRATKQAVPPPLTSDESDLLAKLDFPSSLGAPVLKWHDNVFLCQEHPTQPNHPPQMGLDSCNVCHGEVHKVSYVSGACSI